MEANLEQVRLRRENREAEIWLGEKRPTSLLLAGLEDGKWVKMVLAEALENCRVLLPQLAAMFPLSFFPKNPESLKAKTSAFATFLFFRGVSCLLWAGSRPRLYRINLKKKV